MLICKAIISVIKPSIELAGDNSFGHIFLGSALDSGDFAPIISTQYIRVLNLVWRFFNFFN